MRTTILVALALMLAVAAPAASQASASEMTAEGDVHVAASDAMLEAKMRPGGFDLEARHVVLTLVDDWFEFYQTPSGDSLVGTDRQQDTETISMRGVKLEATDADADGVLIVLSETTGHRVTSFVQGRVDVAGADDQILEKEHWTTEDGIGIPYGNEYEYSAGTDLALTMGDMANHTVQGDFTIYLWGTTFTALHDDGAHTHRTGFHETASPTDGGSGVLVRQHYVHALLDVRDGKLSATGPGGIYGDDVGLALDGVALLSRADGTLSTAEGDHELSGGATVEDGAYSLTRGGSGIQISVQEQPTSVRGDIVSTTTAASTPLPMGAVAGVAAALLLAVGMVYARPAVVAGVGERHYRHIAIVPPPRMTWRELRAEGHRRLAYRAEGNGACRRALWHARCAARIEPDNPDTCALRGRLQRQLGRYDDAVESHKRAHAWFDALDQDRDEMASNAYEAARACALDGRRDAALHWLGIALRGDPELCDEVASEPDFASIRASTEFLSLMRGWKPNAGEADDLLAP